MAGAGQQNSQLPEIGKALLQGGRLHRGSQPLKVKKVLLQVESLSGLEEVPQHDNQHEVCRGEEGQVGDQGPSDLLIDLSVSKEEKGVKPQDEDGHTARGALWQVPQGQQQTASDSDRLMVLAEQALKRDDEAKRRRSIDEAHERQQQNQVIQSQDEKGEKKRRKSLTPEQQDRDGGSAGGSLGECGVLPPPPPLTPCHQGNDGSKERGRKKGSAVRPPPPPLHPCRPVIGCSVPNCAPPPPPIFYQNTPILSTMLSTATMLSAATRETPPRSRLRYDELDMMTNRQITTEAEGRARRTPGPALLAQLFRAGDADVPDPSLPPWGERFIVRMQDDIWPPTVDLEFFSGYRVVVGYCAQYQWKDGRGSEVPQRRLVQTVSAVTGRSQRKLTLPQRILWGTSQVLTQLRELLLDNHFALRSSDQLTFAACFTRQIWPDVFDAIHGYKFVYVRTPPKHGFDRVGENSAENYSSLTSMSVRMTEDVERRRREALAQMPPPLSAAAQFTRPAPPHNPSTYVAGLRLGFGRLPPTEPRH